MESTIRRNITRINDYAPNYGSDSNENGEFISDESGNLKTRATILTDEGGFIANFANSSLAISIGTCTFTNGSDKVQGTSFDTYDLHVGDYVYLTADTVTAAKRIIYFTATELTLSGAYAGTGGTGASSRQIMKSVVGSGASIAVANGVCVLTSGTTTGAITELERDVDYFPMRSRSALTFSDATSAASTAYFGFYDETIASAKTFARFKFSGTSTTTVICETGWNPLGSVTANETQSSTVQLGGVITAQHIYEVYCAFDAVVFTIDDVIVASHKLVIPHMHDEMACSLRIVNGTTPSSYTITCNMIACKNFNEVDIATNKVQNVSTQVAVCKNFPIWAPNTTAITFDTNGFNVVRFQIPVAGTASVITPAWSDDGTNFTNGGGFNPVAGGAYVSTITNATAGMWVMPAVGRYLRLTGASNQTGGVIVTLSNRISNLVNPTTPVSGTVSVTGSQAADSSTAVNMVKVGGLSRTSNAAITAGRASDWAMTTTGSGIVRAYSIPELEWVAVDTITNSTTAVQLKEAVASNHNYISGFHVQTATLSGSSVLQVRSTPVASASATIAGNTLVVPATYGWKVGDLVYITASTVTGLTAGNYYYLKTVSTTSLTFSTTRGGSTLAISGTSVTATVTKIGFRTTLATTALPLTKIDFNNPVNFGINLAVEAVTLTAVTGAIDLNVTGFIAP